MRDFEKDWMRHAGIRYTEHGCKHRKKAWCAECLEKLKPNRFRRQTASVRIGMKVPEENIQPVVYLASPYTMTSKIPGKAAYFKRKRYLEACAATVALINEGHVVFSPIVHSHPLAVKHGLAGDWAFWRRQDIAYLYACSELWVLMLPGWKESVGVQEEVKIAQRMGKPIMLVDSATLRTFPVAGITWKGMAT